MRIIRRLFCKHENSVFVRNIYGDEINAAGGKRSWWVCKDCGKHFMKQQLAVDENGKPYCG